MQIPNDPLPWRVQDVGNALSNLELREEETVRLRARNAQLEADLKREGQRHTGTLKENTALKQRLERTASKRR